MTVNQVKVVGLNEFRSALRAAIGKSPVELRKALHKAGEPVIAESRRRIPIGPGRGGHLRDSLVTRVQLTRGRITSKQPYAGGAEWGRFGKWAGWTRRYGSQPRFVWPSLERKGEEVRDIIALELSEILRAFGWFRE